MHIAAGVDSSRNTGTPFDLESRISNPLMVQF